MVGVKPKGSLLLVKVQKEEEKTQAGIIVVSEKNVEPLRAKVLCVGEGAFTPLGKKLPLEVKEGDIVLLHPFAQRKRVFPEQPDIFLVDYYEAVLAIVEDE